MTISEIAVGLTDCLLVIECAFFALVLIRNSDSVHALRWQFVSFFGFTALASLTGGIYHLTVSNALTIAAVMLWKTTVVAVGAVTLAAWSIGANLLFSPPIRGRVVKAAFAAFVIYSGYVLIIDDHFAAVIANYIPAAVFLGIAFICSYRYHPASPVILGLLGLGVTGVAAAIQQLGLALHPVYFNHNATYHLIQAIGLFLIYRAAIFLVSNPQHTDGKGCNKI